MHYAYFSADAGAAKLTLEIPVCTFLFLFVPCKKNTKYISSIFPVFPAGFDIFPLVYISNDITFSYQGFECFSSMWLPIPTNSISLDSTTSTEKKVPQNKTSICYALGIIPNAGNLNDV